MKWRREANRSLIHLELIIHVLSAIYCVRRLIIIRFSKTSHMSLWLLKALELGLG